MDDVTQNKYLRRFISEKHIFVIDSQYFNIKTSKLVECLNKTLKLHLEIYAMLCFFFFKLGSTYTRIIKTVKNNLKHVMNIYVKRKLKNAFR